MDSYVLMAIVMMTVVGLVIDATDIEAKLQSWTGMKPSTGWVILVMVFNGLVLQYLRSNIYKAREMYGIQLPQVYATKQDTKHATIYNCYQRAHLHTLEMQAEFITFSFVASIKYPILAAFSSFLFSFSRIISANGYYTGIAKNRNYGEFGYFGLLTLGACSLMTGLHQIDINLAESIMAIFK